MKKYVLILCLTILAVMMAACTDDKKETAESESAEAAVNENSNEIETDWPRTITDAVGREIILEKKPEKTAMLFFRNLEHVFLLDEAPFAATDVSVLTDWATFVPYDHSQVEDLGSITSLGIEYLLEMQPDIIVVYKNWFEKYGEKLEKVAPVIVVDSMENDWQGALRNYGEIYGKEDLAEENITRIEKLIVDSRDALQEYEDKTFGVIMLDDNQFWAFTTQFIYNKEDGLGLNPPEKYVDMETKGEQISLEGLIEMNPDYMFVADLQGSSKHLEKLLSELETDPVWQSLEAVKNNRVYSLDSSIAAGGPLGIELGVKTIIENINLDK